MSTNAELDALIGSFQHESHRPCADQALHNLKKIASMVKPIMRRRNWRVGMLAEFFPDQGNLLGLNTNRGQIINLRLRYHHDQNSFLPMEQVVDTMLHELCHNEIGPHNEQFHALWDQLRDEHEALVRKGYTGEGFLGRGDRLGGQRIPLHEARRRARAAAEKRRALTANSGQRLGGSGIMRGQDARAVIAAAVERRVRVERGCASGTDAGRQIAFNESIKKEEVTTTQADREDENEATIMQAYIDLIEEEESAKFGADYVPPSAENPAGPRAIPSSQIKSSKKAKSLIEQQRTIEQGLRSQTGTPQTPVSQSSLSSPPSLLPPTNPFSALLQSQQRSTPTSTFTPTRTSAHAPAPAPAPAPSPIPVPTPTPDLIPIQQQQRQQQPETWTCQICTLVNPMNYLTCDACTVERPHYYSQLSPSSPPSSSSSHLPPRPQPQSRPTPTHTPLTQSSSTTKPPRETPSALKPRLSSTQAYEKFERERIQKVNSRPVGWTCTGCRSFMEMEWWTCSSCGRMKDSS